MDADQLREAWQARPFYPFRMHLADGRVFDVSCAERLTISPNGKRAVVWADDRAGVLLEVGWVENIELAGDEPPAGAGP